MEANMEIRPIAKIHTDFPSKFGVPRQSGLTNNMAKIVFLPEYRDMNALRGMEDFSHLWLIWQFSCNDAPTEFAPTVRPPRLGGNTRMGVFATRSPFRPNPLGLSCVKLEKIELDPHLGPVIYVSGADTVDGTPIYDIKPYIPFTDSRSNATGGFSDGVRDYRLEVDLPEELSQIFPQDKTRELYEILAEDPRPSYHNDPDRIYGFPFAGYEIKFKVCQNKLFVTEIKKI